MAPNRLVERGDQLALLRSVVQGPSGNGVVLLSGEAGFGKTSLIRAFVDGLDHRYRVLEATCEPLGIPTAFSPLFDLLDELPDQLRQEIRSGSGRTAVYAGLLDLLKGDRVVLVIEDAHWADESTLGLIRYLGRRIHQTVGALVVSYRTEELDLAHPMQLVIADLGAVATQIELPALSLAGVEQMAKGLDIDPKRVHSATLGNPFLVEEVIRHPDTRLPATISNAVLARAAHLSAPALETLYLVAISPDGLPLDLLLALDSEAGTYVDLGVQRRLLVSRDGQVTCRHDLIRESLDRAVPPALERDLHRRLLDRLTAGAVPAEPSRLAYHAIGAQSPTKAVEYSLEAAEDAARGGAHRQAAHHYSQALQHRSHMEPTTLKRALSAAADEHCLINAFDESCVYAEDLVGIAGEGEEMARAQAWLSYYLSRKNDLEPTRRVAGLAIAGFADQTASEELALAHAVLGWVALVEGTFDDAIDHAEQAISIARSVGAARVEVYAATTLGTCRVILGDEAGRELIEDAVRLGLANGGDEWTAKSMNNLAYSYVWSNALPEARSSFTELVEFTAARELDAWYIAAVTSRGSIDLSLGNWEETDQAMAIALGQRTCRQTEVEALVIAATLAARRGDPGSVLLIESILDRVGESRDFGMVLDATLLAMEASWLGVIAESTALSTYRRALGFGALADDAWARGRLAIWATRLGFDLPPGDIVGPTALETEGRLAEAAEAWDHAGYVVDAEICRAQVEGADLDAVFSRLAEMGASGTARSLRRQLQRLGVKGIPRGERKATKGNARGLTARQAEVFALMQAGLSNSAIAKELYISEKTAEHHVSAILSKLNASSRLHAVAMASADGRGEPALT